MTNGHTGDDANNDGYADDIWVELPAVGSGGLTAIGESCFENNGEIFGDNQDVFNSLVTPMTSSEAQTILDESR